MKPCALLVLGLFLGHSCGSAIAESRRSSSRRDVDSVPQKFAFDLYHQFTANEGENLLLSPSSIELTLRVLAEGARGTTKSELDTLLGTAGWSRDAVDRLVQVLTQRDGEEDETKERRGFQLVQANCVWTRDDVKLAPGFVDRISKQYDATIRGMDFDEPESVRIAINEWVAKETHGFIDALLLHPPDRATSLIATNVVYFDADWLTPFDPDSNREGSFFTANGVIEGVEFMRSELTVRCFKKDSVVQAVELPYVRDGYYALLMSAAPEEIGKESTAEDVRREFKKVEDDFGPKLLQEITKRLKPQRIVLEVPKFQFDNTLDLNSQMRELAPTAFGDSADFGEMVEPDSGGGLRMTGLVQQSRIEFNERGTRAAAATAALVGVGIDAPASFRFDRPMLFVIWHRESGAIFFMGKLATVSSSRSADSVDK